MNVTAQVSEIFPKFQYSAAIRNPIILVRKKELGNGAGLNFIDIHLFWLLRPFALYIFF